MPPAPMGRPHSLLSVLLMCRLVAPESALATQHTTSFRAAWSFDDLGTRQANEGLPRSRWNRDIFRWLLGWMIGVRYTPS